MASRLAALALVLMLIQNSGFVLVMRYSRRQQQGMDAAQYNVAVVVVLQELFKLVFCFVATTAQESAGAAVRTLGQYQEAARVLVPAACFTLQNNILYVALSNLDPLVFQITYQIKTLLTALLSVHLLKRSFSRWQWVSQLLLTAGVVLTQLNESPDRKVDEGARQKQSLLLGLLAVLTAAASSSYASVYFERLLKERVPRPSRERAGAELKEASGTGGPPTAAAAASLWARNTHLCMWTVPMNLLLAAGQASADTWRAPLHGFEASTWLIIVVNGLGGLLVAVVMKYADNILKGFATAGAIVLTGVLGYLLGLSPAPGLMLLVGGALVIGSMFMYSSGATKRPVLPRPVSPPAGDEQRPRTV